MTCPKCGAPMAERPCTRCGYSTAEVWIMGRSTPEGRAREAKRRDELAAQKAAAEKAEKKAARKRSVRRRRRARPEDDPAG